MNTTTKGTDMASSKSLFVSLFSIVALILTANHVDMSQYNADTLYAVFTSSQGSALLLAIFSFLLEIGSRAFISFKLQGFSFDFLKSPNFMAALISLVSVIVSRFFNVFYAGIIVAITTQVINIVYHLLQPVTDVPVIVPTVVEKV